MGRLKNTLTRQPPRTFSMAQPVWSGKHLFLIASKKGKRRETSCTELQCAVFVLNYLEHKNWSKTKETNLIVGRKSLTWSLAGTMWDVVGEEVHEDVFYWLFLFQTQIPMTDGDGTYGLGYSTRVPIELWLSPAFDVNWVDLTSWVTLRIKEN